MRDKRLSWIAIACTATLACTDAQRARDDAATDADAVATIDADAATDAATDADAPFDASIDADADAATDAATDAHGPDEIELELLEGACDDLQDGDGDGLVDCDDDGECATDPACDPGAGALFAPCVAASDCAGPAPLCQSEVLTGHPGGACSRWCDPASAGSCGPDAYCYGEPPERGRCVPRCDPVAAAGGCREGYACAPFQIFEGVVIDIGICVAACADDSQCPALGACYDDSGQAQSGRCVPPERCDAPGDEDHDGRLDCEDEDCAALVACDPAPVCAAPVATLVVGAEPLIVEGDTRGGTTIFSASCTGTHGGNERVYRVTAGAPGETGRLDVQLGGGPDLGVYLRADCADAASEIGCADNTYSDETEYSSFAIAGGVPYALFVDAIGDDAGAFTLGLAFVADVCGDGAITGAETCDDGKLPPEPGDGCSATCRPELDVLCAAARPLPPATPVSGNAIDSASAYFQGSCTLPENSAREDLYVYTAAATGQARVSVLHQGGTTDLAVYVRAVCTDPASELACADDERVDGTESVTLPVVAGTSYWVIVDGMLSDFDVGPYLLVVEAPD